jgi:hypothetical protein
MRTDIYALSFDYGLRNKDRQLANPAIYNRYANQYFICAAVQLTPEPGVRTMCC